MKRILWVMMLMAALFGVVEAKEVVRIGAILPITGDLAAYGEPVRDAMLLAAEEITRQETKFEYKLIIEDNQANTTKTALAGQRLINLNKVDCMLGLWPEACYPIAPVVKRANIPMIVLAVWDRKLADGKTIFALTTSIEKEFDEMFKVIKALGYKRIAIIYGKDAGFGYVAETTARKLKKAGMEPVSMQGFVPGERDFTTIILKIKEAKPELLINLSAEPEIFLVEKKIREMDLRCDITTYEAYDAMQDRTLALGRWYVTGAQNTEEFKRKFKERWHYTPGYATGIAYDSVKLFCTAYEETGMDGKKPKTDAIIAWLKAVKGRAGSAGDLEMDNEGVIETPAQLMWVGKEKMERITVEEIVGKKTVAERKIEM